MEIIYQAEPDLPAEEFREVLIKSTLGERRPIDDMARLEQMCRNAGLIVTARADGKLVGVARSVTDHIYCTYLSDLAVDEAYQRQGIGKGLIAETKKLTPQAMLILVSAPAAINYYPKTGMTLREHCYVLHDVNDLR